MKLRITEEAQKKIQKVCQSEDYLILDFEDAVGPFVDSGASCQLYPNFRLLFVPREFPKNALSVYDDQLETVLGKVYIKRTSERYLDQEVRLIVEKNYQRLQLVSDSGVLATNVPMKKIVLNEKGQYSGEISRNNGPSC